MSKYVVWLVDIMFNIFIIPVNLSLFTQWCKSGFLCMTSVSCPVIGRSKCPSLWLTSVLTYVVFFSPSSPSSPVFVCIIFFLVWVVGGCFIRCLSSRRCFCSPRSTDSHVRLQSTASGQPRPTCKTQSLRAPLRSPGCCVCVCVQCALLSWCLILMCAHACLSVRQGVCVWLIRSLVEKPTFGIIQGQLDVESSLF